MRLGVVRQQVTGIFPIDQVIISSILKLRPQLYILPGGLILSMMALSYFQGIRLKQNSLTHRLIYLLLTMFCMVIFMIGYGMYFYYNVVVYPIIFCRSVFSWSQGDYNLSFSSILSGIKP